MKEFPTISDTGRYREVLTTFGGYNHKLSCAEGEFYNMTNMTATHYPILSPRNKRGIVKSIPNCTGLTTKEKLVWVSGEDLYIDNTKVTLSVALSSAPKTIAKMGAYIIIFPDKVWYNTDTSESGSLDASFSNGTFSTAEDVSFTLADSYGTAITWHDEAYYTTHAPQSGDYCMFTSDGKTTLKQWSSASAIWIPITTTFLQMTVQGIGANFNVGDGVNIQIDNTLAQWSDAPKVFVNDDGNGKYSSNFVILDKTNNVITITGIISANKVFSLATSTPMPVKVTRKVPEMAFVTECNNRLWGCSEDGHEIYACKLGDPLNWNVFAGISTDSWAATVGSDGKFTGAITYLGYPIFFKEESLIKVSISSAGAHQTKETYCRGVQAGSEKSLCILNEVLYYKSTSAVCAYSGAVPASISDNFGVLTYSDAVGGTIDDRYFLSMKDTYNKWHLFVFDSVKGLWVREDSCHVEAFTKCGDDLYFISDGNLMSVKGNLPYAGGTTEADFDWLAESGTIGYNLPDQKYIERVSLRLQLDFGSRIDFYIEYDSSGKWEHVFNVNGTGLRSFTIPVIPMRCDHFKYKIVGHGMGKIYSIAKTMEEGSDICST